MAEIRIRVGAALDSSARHVFKPLVSAAAEARRQIAREFAALPGQIRPSQARITAEARAAARGQAAAAREGARDEVRAARDATKAIEREWRQRVRMAEQAMRQEHSAMARQQREAARFARQQSRELESFARRTSHRATRFFWPNMPIASMGRRVAGDVVRGLGIDPTIAGAMQRNIGLETQAVNITNQARLAGQNVAPGAFEAVVRSVSTKHGLSREGTGGALEQFQKKTGNLEAGMALLDKMAERAAVTNTNLDDVGSALAGIYQALPEGERSFEKALDVFDAMVAHGARGAVEMSDAAKQAERITAPAAMFEGDVGSNIKRLSALTQTAREKGGAPSAAEAFRSASNFVQTLQKPARLKQFKGVGIDVINKDSKLLKNPFELITESLLATGGDPEKMNKLFQDAIGARAVRGLTNDFNRAGGGQAGIAAVEKQLNKYMANAVLTQDQINKAQSAREETTAVKVQRFQNRLDDVASEAQARLLPALERLAPVALTAAEGLGKLVTFTAENPGKAIVAAITASIARAGLESAFRASIERAIIGGAGGIAGAGGIGGGMAALGALGIGAVGVAAAAASADHLSTQTGGWGGIYAGLESAGQSFDKAGVMGMLTGVGHFSALGGFRQGVEDYQNDQARDEAIRLRRAQAAEAIANAQFGTGLPKDQTGRHGKAEQAMVRAQENAKRVGDAVGAALTGRTLNVRVTNAGDIGGAGGGGMPGVDGAGRHNPPPVELAPDFS